MSEPSEQQVVLVSMKYCVNCGAQIDAKAEICPHCGVRQPMAAVHGRKNRVTAALLAFFLGGLGAHKFYLGDTGLGILYILFCWTLIPGLIAFVEAIIYLTTSDEEFAEKYG